jgi:hypothetical protein
MQPTISIPQGWQYPRFGFGQRTERGIIIGLKYYSDDTLLAHEYGQGWRYVVLPDENDEDEEHRLEDELQLLTPQELRAEIEAEIAKRLHQIEMLTHELKAIPVSVVND